jgi:putative flippase GtrA
MSFINDTGLLHMVEALALRFISWLPLRYQNTARQFVKFAITGTVGAVVDFGTYGILTRAFGWTSTYLVLGYQISAPNNVSVFLAILSNFILNKYWTFRTPGGNIAGQGAGYFVLNVITWTLNQILMSYFTFRVPAFAAAFGDLRDIAAKVAAIAIILMLNFLGSKFLVFRKQPQMLKQN